MPWRDLWRPWFQRSNLFVLLLAIIAAVTVVNIFVPPQSHIRLMYQGFLIGMGVAYLTSVGAYMWLNRRLEALQLVARDKVTEAQVTQKDFDQLVEDTDEYLRGVRKQAEESDSCVLTLAIFRGSPRGLAIDQTFGMQPREVADCVRLLRAAADDLATRLPPR